MSSSTCAAESSSPSGISAKSGSARWRSRSPAVSANSRARMPASSPPSRAEPPSASRAARISSSTNPWEFGGAVSTSSPLKRPAIGSASAVSCSARSSRVSLDPSDRSRFTRSAPTSPPYNTDGPSAAMARSVRARAGWHRGAPSGRGAPSARKTARNPVSAASSRCSSPIAEASERETATPSSAYTTAASSASARLRRPPSESNVVQAATAPGTVTGAGPVSGICACVPRRSPAEAAEAEAPLPLTVRAPPCGVCTSAMMSPPTAQLCGYTTVSAAAAATAASIALPPLRNASAPASLARRCGVAIANERPAVRASLTALVPPPPATGAGACSHPPPSGRATTWRR